MPFWKLIFLSIWTKPHRFCHCVMHLGKFFAAVLILLCGQWDYNPGCVIESTLVSIMNRDWELVLHQNLQENVALKEEWNKGLVSGCDVSWEISCDFIKSWVGARGRMASSFLLSLLYFLYEINLNSLRNNTLEDIQIELNVKYVCLVYTNLPVTKSSICSMG